MPKITCEDLKEKIDRGDEFKLIMVLGEWQFRAKHIPGSLNISSPDDPKFKDLTKEEEIVVYCSDIHCATSHYVHDKLEREGYNVRHFAGGINEWEEAGYPVEGEWAK